MVLFSASMKAFCMLPSFSLLSRAGRRKGRADLLGTAGLDDVAVEHVALLDPDIHIALARPFDSGLALQRLS